MANGNWAIDVDNIIYSLLSSEIEYLFKGKFKNLYVTNSSVSPDTPKFPTVYIYPLQSVEIGNTTEQDKIEAIIYGLQIEVTGKRTSDTVGIPAVKTIMSEIVNIMKSRYGFNVVGLPLAEETKDLFIMKARFQRKIGEGDKIGGMA